MLSHRSVLASNKHNNDKPQQNHNSATQKTLSGIRCWSGKRFFNPRLIQYLLISNRSALLEDKIFFKLLLNNRPFGCSIGAHPVPARGANSQTQITRGCIGQRRACPCAPTVCVETISTDWRHFHQAQWGGRSGIVQDQLTPPRRRLDWKTINSRWHQTSQDTSAGFVRDSCACSLSHKHKDLVHQCFSAGQLWLSC